MPSELLLTPKDPDSNPVVSQNESTILVALRVEADAKLLEEMEMLQSILTDEKAPTQEKNEAFDKMKDLNIIRGEEDSLEKKIKEKHNLDSFVKIKNDEIQITINSSDHNTKLANDIMRTVQENYKTKMYISVKFTK